MLGIEERLLIGRVLLIELNSEVAKLPAYPLTPDLPKYIRKAQMVKTKMYLFYAGQEEKSPELLEQIHEMDKIIKKLEELQNKHVT